MLISGLLFVYFIQIHCVVTASINNTQSKNENISQVDSISISSCSEFENDDIVVSSDDFNIPLNPSNKKSKTYGATYGDGRIFHLDIFNKTSIPSTVFRLKHLKRLEVRKTCFSPCNHQRIPDEIECLASSLTVLSIYDTKITHLPRRIGKLRHLQTLILSNIGLTNLPDSIGDLSSLKTLYLANNNLISLPSTINNLRSLTDINLTNNPYLHSIQPLNGLPSLRSLDARHCSIKDLPRDLPQLIDVLMTNNNLTRLVGIKTLGSGTNNTKSFHFDKNRIQFISPNIRAVKNLFRLNLNNNQLKTLPSDIFNIPTLRDLYVNNNPLNGDDLKRVNAKFNISYKSRPKPSKQKIQ